MQAQTKQKLSNFDAVIFDFDGVILDSEPIHYKACSQVLNDLGINISYAEFKEKCVGMADKDMFPQLLAGKSYFLSAAEINSLIVKKVNNYNNLINECDHLPIINAFDQYIHYVLQQLKKIAICSGSSSSEIAAVMNKLKPNILSSFFNPIVTSEDVQYGKPDPEGYLLASKYLGVVPHRCLVIEDSPHGIAAAKSAGMYVIGLLTTHPKEELKHADIIANNFADLLD